MHIPLSATLCNPTWVHIGMTVPHRILGPDILGLYLVYLGKVFHQNPQVCVFPPTHPHGIYYAP